MKTSVTMCRSVVGMAAAAALWGGLGTAAQAAVIGNDCACFGFSTSLEIGQTFVAADPELLSIAFGFRDPSSSGASLTVNLYEGEGFGGTLLGSRTTTPVLQQFTQQLVSFDFSGISLTPGATYTASYQLPSRVVGARGTAYADGSIYIDGSTEDGDLWFAVTGTSVPEPATWGLMIMGFAGLGSAMRRNRCTAV